MTSMMKMVRTKFEIHTNMIAQLNIIYMHESMQVPAFSTQTSSRDKNPIFSTPFGSVTFTRAKYRILSHFSFPKTLFPSFSNHHCLQFLYTPCFSILHA